MVRSGIIGDIPSLVPKILASSRGDGIVLQFVPRVMALAVGVLGAGVDAEAQGEGGVEGVELHSCFDAFVWSCRKVAIAGG
jgi:hypothetical protein